MTDPTSLRVTLDGCDDATEVVLDVTPDERAFLDRLSALINSESTFQCMPTMNVRPGGDVA